MEDSERTVEFGGEAAQKNAVEQEEPAVVQYVDARTGAVLAEYVRADLYQELAAALDRAGVRDSAAARARGAVEDGYRECLAGVGPTADGTATL